MSPLGTGVVGDTLSPLGTGVGDTTLASFGTGFPLRAAAPPLRLMLAKTLSRFAQHEALRVRIPLSQPAITEKASGFTAGLPLFAVAGAEGFEPP